MLHEDHGDKDHGEIHGHRCGCNCCMKDKARPGTGERGCNCCLTRLQGPKTSGKHNCEGLSMAARILHEAHGGCEVSIRGCMVVNIAVSSSHKYRPTRNIEASV